MRVIESGEEVDDIKDLGHFGFEGLSFKLDRTNWSTEDDYSIVIANVKLVPAELENFRERHGGD